MEEAVDGGGSYGAFNATIITDVGTMAAASTATEQLRMRTAITAATIGQKSHRRQCHCIIAPPSHRRFCR
jgi:hypothetical protein